MTAHENKFPNNKGHIEMQQELLRSLQGEISERLFLSGAASRIVAARPSLYGAATSVEGVDQLDKQFLPSLAKKVVDGREEQVLKLAVITEKEGRGRSFGYTDLGEIDPQGFLHVFPGIPEDDAWAVLREATELQKLKTGDGDNQPTLPNLEYNLLGISNPYTAIQAMPKKV